jgi:putative spermidine/putrescine transport system permease protein
MSTNTAIARNRGRGGTTLRWVVLAIAAIYFIGPLLAAISFTIRKPGGGITFSAYRQIFDQPGDTSFGHALTYSLIISVITIVLSLALMVPTQLLLHLRLPRWRGLVEVICLLPLVFPPVVLVVGVSGVYRWAQPEGEAEGGVAFHVLRFVRDSSHPLLLPLLYAVMTMPFVYRAIDAGLRSIDVATLVEASRSLGASWPTTIASVLLPSLRTALTGAAFLCFALVMGEYTVASILLYTKPFPVWLAQLPTTSGQVRAAISVFSLLLVQALLLVVSGLGMRGAKRKEAH